MSVDERRTREAARAAAAAALASPGGDVGGDGSGDGSDDDGHDGDDGDDDDDEEKSEDTPLSERLADALRSGETDGELDAAAIQRALTLYPPILTIACVQFSGSLVMLLLGSWRLTLVGVCSLPLAVFRNWDKIREWHATQQVQRNIPPQARTLSVSRGDLIAILNN